MLNDGKDQWSAIMKTLLSAGHSTRELIHSTIVRSIANRVDPSEPLPPGIKLWLKECSFPSPSHHSEESDSDIGM